MVTCFTILTGKSSKTCTGIQVYAIIASSTILARATFTFINVCEISSKKILIHSYHCKFHYQQSGKWYLVCHSDYSMVAIAIIFEDTNICKSNLNTILILIMVGMTFNSSSLNNNFTSIFIKDYLFHNLVQ